MGAVHDRCAAQGREALLLFLEHRLDPRPHLEEHLHVVGAPVNEATRGAVAARADQAVDLVRLGQRRAWLGLGLGLG